MAELLARALADFQANLWLYLSMPLTSGLIGYVTNVLAIRMMFHPLEFVGIRPWLGWQGVVPRKAGRMAAIATDTIVPRLVTEQEIFDRLDPERIAAEIEKPITEAVDQIFEQIMVEYEPALWESLPLALRDRIKRRIREEAPEVVAEVMAELRENIHEVFDLKEMVVSTLMRDKQLINRVFLECGREEFRFIGHCGFYFGFLFGLLQMVGWTLYKADWQLPLFGLVVGHATNWIALRMIFRPQQPRRIFGITFQGLFHKRQQEVARDHARLIADEIVTPANIIEAVLKGPYADRVFEMIARNVKRAIDEQAGIARPFIAWTVGTRKYIEMKNAAVERIVARLPEALRRVDRYAREAMAIGEVLAERLAALPPDQFEDMLRPAFREDEWMLIAVGAALGFAVGVLQLIAFKAWSVAPVLAAAGA